MKSGGAEVDDTELRTFAMVVYEFTVGGRKYQGSRVSIGEELGNFQVAETLAKYPKGKTVTVFYNPRTPTEAVLERDLPAGIWKGLIIIVAVLVALIFGGWFGFSRRVALDTPDDKRGRRSSPPASGSRCSVGRARISGA